MPHKRMKIFFYFGGSLCICDKNEEPPNLKFCIMQGEQDVMQEGENIFLLREVCLCEIKMTHPKLEIFA